MRYLRTISTRLIASSVCRRNPPPPDHNPIIRLIGGRYTDDWCVNALNSVREYNTAAAEEKKVPAVPSKKVVEIVDELSELTLLEVSDLTELLRKKLNIEEMPAMAMMMPGMGFSVKGGKGGSGGGVGKVEEEKKEKTAYDLKLDGFDAAAKIKIIKEVRTFTDLGLKEAKELVEKAPIVLKRGVAKEEAEKIIAKMKEVGAKVSME